MKELKNEKTEYAVGRLEAQIEARDLKQAQLEQLSGVDQSTISRILKRSLDPSPEILKKLFQAIGLRLADVLNESDAIAQELLGYLATPLTAVCGDPHAETELANVVARIKKVGADAEFSARPFELYWPGDHTHPVRNADFSAAQVYLIDRSRASTYDFIVLFCGSPSYGVGQENEIATQAGIPAIRLLPEGISRMMSGSFINAVDVKYRGNLSTEVQFNQDDLRTAFRQIRLAFFRRQAFYKGMNGDGLGARLRKLVNERCGDDQQFADDLGVSLPYLKALIEEPLSISNPSIRLLKRMAILLDERVGYLIGESEETDPIWVGSNSSWHSWITKTPNTDGAQAVIMRDIWRRQYFENRRQSATSFRKSSRKLMRESDWDKLYQQSKRSNGNARKSDDGSSRQGAIFGE